MKINDIKANDQYFLLEGPLDYLKDKFTDSSGDREFGDYKEGLKKDFLRWSNLTQGSKDPNNVELIKQWLVSQYGLSQAEADTATGTKSEAPAQAQAEPNQQAQAEPAQQPAAQAQAEPAQAAQPTPANTAQADKVKANIAANQKARQGGGNSMDLNKWYQDYQAEQNPQNKLNLVKELVNRVADYGPQDVESMKAILKKIRDPQNTPFINAALQKMSAGKDMAVNPQGNAKPQAKQAPQQPAGPTASAQADQNLPGFMQSKIKGVQRPAAPAFTKQTVNNSVMYHVNAIVEALGYTMEQLGFAVLKESATTSTIYNKAMLTESQLMELDMPREPGTIGKVAGAIGGGIGAVKGAWQGAKDAFSGQKAAGTQSTRAHVAGNDLGASGDAQAQGGATGGAMPGASAGGGDLWDKVTRLMYQTGRLETNPKNNMANKIGNFMLKGTGYQYDNTKGMARGGYNPQGQATGGTAPAQGKAQAGAPGSTAQKLAAMAKGETPTATEPAQSAQQPAAQAEPAQGAQQPAQGAQQPAQDATADQGDQAQGEVTGTLDAGQLAKMLPGIDSMNIARGIADLKGGKQVGAKQKQAFGDAMVALLKADPATTARVMNSLNKISAGQGVSSKVGNAPATSGVDSKGNATAESVQQRRAKRLAEQIFKGVR